MDNERVYQALHHYHIPLLVTAGFVVTDPDHDWIEATRAAEQLDLA